MKDAAKGFLFLIMAIIGFTILFWLEILLIVIIPLLVWCWFEANSLGGYWEDYIPLFVFTACLALFTGVMFTLYHFNYTNPRIGHVFPLYSHRITLEDQARFMKSSAGHSGNPLLEIGTMGALFNQHYRGSDLRDLHRVLHANLLFDAGFSTRLMRQTEEKFSWPVLRYAIATGELIPRNPGGNLPGDIIHRNRSLMSTSFILEFRTEEARDRVMRYARRLNRRSVMWGFNTIPFWYMSSSLLLISFGLMCGTVVLRNLLC